MEDTEDPSTSLMDSRDTHNQRVANVPVSLKKNIGLMEGIALIITCVIGAGIFVSPKGVFSITGSVGLTLIVWVATGVVVTVGALCYAELGTMIPESGGLYSYLLESFGPLPAFIGVWVMAMIRNCAGLAVVALTFSTYLVQAVLVDCHTLPQVPIKLLAALLIGLLTLVNCANVRWAVQVQNVFTVSKMLALIVIILTGIIHLAQGNTLNYDNLMEGSNWSITAITTATFQSLFSYIGWENVCYVVEELKNPERNLPIAIVTSLVMVTVIYTLTNAAYLAVLSPAQMLSSDAVALTFGNLTLGVMSWVMPLFVILNLFGSVNGIILARSRLVYVAARRGHFPQAFSLLHINKFTPIPAIIFNGMMATLMLVSSEITYLVQYTTFGLNVISLGNILGLLWLRYKEPNRPRPYKVPLVLPIVYIVMQVFLLVLPIIYDPVTVGISIALIASALPVYYLLVYRQDLTKRLSGPMDKVTKLLQLLFLSVPGTRVD